jgi:hypothetical protein
MWDDVGFFLANFQHFLHKFDEPFVFPSQVQQSFFGVTPKHHFGELPFTKNLEVNESWQTSSQT